MKASFSRVYQLGGNLNVTSSFGGNQNFENIYVIVG